MTEPLIRFRACYEAAQHAGIPKANAMTLATADASGRVSARVVLLSSFDARGFVFHGNYESGKGLALRAHPRAALVFWWDNTGCQIRIEGRVEPTTPAESDAYFAGRPRASQLGAWASAQSREIPSREALEARLRAFETEYADRAVPRPPHWGGWRVLPDRYEFWQDREHRLHDRLVYEREGDGWRVIRLAP